MGAKYLPTIKDQKAHGRFQRQQLVQSKFIKPAAPKPGPAKSPAVEAGKSPAAGKPGT
jgi:hypothetical protein